MKRAEFWEPRRPGACHDARFRDHAFSVEMDSEKIVIAACNTFVDPIISYRGRRRSDYIMRPSSRNPPSSSSNLFLPSGEGCAHVIYLWCQPTLHATHGTRHEYCRNINPRWLPPSPQESTKTGTRKWSYYALR